MTTLREAAQQALEALLTPSGAQACSTCQNGPENEYCCRMEMWSAITALRAALAQEQDEPVEPVAWMFELARNFNLEGYGGWEKRITEYRPNTPEGSVRNVTPLYTAPPQRKPLTDEEVRKHLATAKSHEQTWLMFARAIERAHGIGGEA